MTLTDPIADMLTRIRNATRVRKSKVDIRRSRICLGMIRLLKREGFVEDFKEVDEGPQGAIRVYLKYGEDGEDVIRRIERVSKPGRRVYRQVAEIQPVLSGMGMSIFSTPKGVLTDRDCREQNVGGEFLATVY